LIVGKEPPPRQRRVPFASVDVYVISSVFSLAVDHVFAVERVILVWWLVRPVAFRPAWLEGFLLTPLRYRLEYTGG
jgi:hypothetical protein